MTKEQRATLQALAKSATPGQWRFENVKHGNGLELVTDASNKYGVMYAHSEHGNPRLAFRRVEDMDYIAAASPATVLQLLAEHESLTARVQELQAQPEALPAPTVPDSVVEAVMLNLTQAWRLGQAMHQHASRNSAKAMDMAQQTQAEFNQLKDQVRALLTAQATSEGTL